MIREKHFLVLLLITGLFLPAHAQSYTTQETRLIDRLHSLAESATPELAYIQTSKDIYETGEDLWFKVYLLDAQYFIPSLLSKTLYLELLNETTKKVVWQEKYEIVNGIASGRVFIESSLAEGDYLLEVFTSSSFFNAATEFKAVKRIRIKTDITWQPLIKVKFDKNWYGEGDSVKVILSPTAWLQDSSVSEIIATLQHGEKRIARVKTTCAGKEKSIIAFAPTPTDITDELQINVVVKNGTREETRIMNVPCKGNPVQFNVFPEGGNLVSGIRNRLAFKAVNINGEPVDIKGTLFEDSSPLLLFKSIHSGMGSLEFRPVAGKKYSIQLSEPSLDSTYLLPEILNSGMVLKLINRDREYLIFKVSKSSDLESQDIYLRVQCRGIVYGMSKAKLRSELKMKVPLTALPQGIAEITLFNSNLVPVAERLVYINREKRLNITAEISGPIYPTRGKVELKITTKDEYNQPVKANLGLTVFDKLYQNQSDTSNILSHCYLSSQLKGRIYNPGFYFNNGNRNSDEALDLLMMTQGWRRYIWNELNLKTAEEEGYQRISDEIHGEIYFPHRRKKVPGKPVFVMAFSPNIDSTKVLISADSAGRFIVGPDKLKEWENDYIYLKPFGPRGTQFTMAKLDPLALPDYILGVKLTDPFEVINSLMDSVEVSHPFSGEYEQETDTSDTFTAKNGVVTIKQVTIKSKKKRVLRGKYMGILDSLASKDDYVCKYCVLNCPRHTPDMPDDGQPPVCYEKKPIPGKEYYVIYNYNTPLEYTRLITYWRSRYTEDDLLKINNYYRIKAYYGYREFYKPNYDIPTAESEIPDFRNTLLWDPAVVTNEKGEATISFYCSDINTDFIGRIEGTDGEGLLGADYFNFTVRKLKLN